MTMTLNIVFCFSLNFFFVSAVPIPYGMGRLRTLFDVARVGMGKEGCSPGKCILLLGWHCKTPTLNGAEFVKPFTFTGTKFGPKSIPLLAQSTKNVLILFGFVPLRVVEKMVQHPRS